MSRFGLGLVGDFEDDPIFGSHMRQVNQVMNSMFADPFGLMGPPALTNDHHQQIRMNPMPGMQMMPFGFPMMPSLPMGRMFAGLGTMNPDGQCHSFSSSSIMTMTSSGPDGRPQVYQETMSTRTAPGGVKETKKTVSDSVSGTRSMAIGHHIGDRAHILEREHNMRSGEQEERQEFINLEEEEAERFNYEWEARTKRSAGAIANSSHRTRNPYNRSEQENKQLALPSTVPTSQQSNSQFRPIATPRRTIRSSLSSRTSNGKSSSRSAESSASASTSTDSKTITSPSTLVTSPERAKPEDVASTTTWSTTPSVAMRSSNSNRKREHSPGQLEVAVVSPNKRLSHSQSQSSDTKHPIPCIDVTD